MTLIFLAALIGGLVAAVTASMAAPVVTRIAMAVRAMDYPGGRRLQSQAVPRMGGIAIAAGITAGAASPALILWQQWIQNVMSPEIVAVTLGAAAVFAIGLADDVIGLSCIQ